MSDKNKTDNDSDIKKQMKSQNFQENGLRLYNIKQSIQTQKERKKWVLSLRCSL